MTLATIRLIAAALLGGVAALSAGQAPTPGVTTLGVNGRTNASASIAASGQVVAVAWGATRTGGATDIYPALSRDGGRTFGAPVRVNDVDGDASVGGEQPPHVALVPRANREPSIVVVWTAKRKDGTRILSARSDDGAASFTRAMPLSGGEAAGNRGWEAIAADRDGHVVSVWLDHRELAGASAGTTTPMRHEGHDHAARGKTPVDGAGTRAAVEAVLLEAGRREGGEGRARRRRRLLLLQDGDCRGPGWLDLRSLAACVPGQRPGRRLHAVPRRRAHVCRAAPRVRRSLGARRVPGERSGAGARQPAARSHRLADAGCRRRTPTQSRALELFHALSSDGRTFTPRRRLPAEGVPRHAQMTSTPDDSLVVVWEEQAGGTRRVVAGRASGDGPFTRQVVSTSGRASYPVVVSAGASTLVAWTSEVNDRSTIRVSRLAD